MLAHGMKAKPASGAAVNGGFSNTAPFPIVSTKDSASPTLTVGTEPGRITN